MSLERLERARRRYNGRINAVARSGAAYEDTATSEGLYMDVNHDSARALFSGTDLPYEDVIASSYGLAADQLEGLLTGRTALLDLLAAIYRTGLLTGVLFAQDKSEEREPSAD